MGIEKELQKAFRDSKEYLGSMSALELVEKSALFMRDLKKLVNSQGLPATVVIGCLMNEVDRLNTETDDLLLDDHITKAFISFKRYVDKNFMKKE